MFLVLVIMLLVALSVLIHYEALNRISKKMPLFPKRTGANIVFGILGAMLAHFLEIVIFALGYHLLNKIGHFGALTGAYQGHFGDSLYYSFVVYTSLGFGDILPQGALRYLTGVEALTGLVLIAWTASFLYLEMQRFWKNNQDLNQK